MISFNGRVATPVQGYFPAAGAKAGAGAQPVAKGADPQPAAIAAAPAAVQPYQSVVGFGMAWPLDLANIVAHPIKTIQSFGTLLKDVTELSGQKGLSIASADGAIARYQAAMQDLDAAPFKHIFPFFGMALDHWADARFQELKPQVEQSLSQRCMHPVSLEWPDGGSGNDRLNELLLFRDQAAKASDGQLIRGLMGYNRIQVRNSSAMDYFYPLAQAGDALILRRNLPLIPNQKPLSETLQGYLNQAVAVHVEIQR